jgi:hypothetical protein
LSIIWLLQAVVAAVVKLAAAQVKAAVAQVDIVAMFQAKILAVAQAQRAASLYYFLPLTH